MEIWFDYSVLHFTPTYTNQCLCTDSIFEIKTLVIYQLSVLLDCDGNENKWKINRSVNTNEGRGIFEVLFFRLSARWMIYILFFINLIINCGTAVQGWTSTKNVIQVTHSFGVSKYVIHDTFFKEEKILDTVKDTKKYIY